MSGWRDLPPCPPIGLSPGAGIDDGACVPAGAKSTTTTLVLDGTNKVADINDGDVVSYVCVGY